MADLETIRVLRVKGETQGMDEVVRALERAGKAYTVAGAGADALGVQSDSSARKVLSSAGAVERIAARLDPAEKAAQQFARSLNAVSRAAEGGYFDRFANGAERMKGLVTGLQREFEKLGQASKSMGAGSSMSPGDAEASFQTFESVAQAKAQQIGQEFGRALNERLVPGVGKAARDSAAAFEEALRPIEDIARMKGAQAGAYFGQDLNTRLIAGVSKSARDSASVFEESFRPMEEAARHRGQWIADEFTRSLNERLVAGMPKSARESASAFEDAYAQRDNAQQAFNQQLGVKPWQASGSQAGQSAAAFMEEDAKAARALRVEYDQLAIAAERRDDAINKANALYARGAVTVEQHTNVVAGANRVYNDTERALNRTGTSVGKYANGLGLARHEMINFSRQVQDIGVSLYSGQAFWTVAIQQGTQLFDIFSTSRASAGGFFSQLIGGAAKFATSLTGVITGVAAFGIAAAVAGNRWADSQRAVEISLMGIGRQSGQTVENINRIAEAAANAGRISRGSARDIASTFAGAGVSGSLIDTNLVDTMSRGYGVLTGKSQKEAAQDLAGALASPTAGAQELEKRLGKLSDAQMEFIRNAEASGDKLGAQRALLDSANPTLSEAAQKTGLLARAWEAVTKAIDGTAEAFGRAVSGQKSLEDQMADAIKRRDGMAEGLKGRTAPGRAQIERENNRIDSLSENIRFNARARDTEARQRADDLRTNDLSRRAGDITRGQNTDIGRRQELENQFNALEKALGDQSVLRKLGPNADAAKEALERLRSGLANFETTSERIQRDFELQVQQTNAYTLTQKATVEAERARLEAIRAGRTELQAGVEAEQARTRVIAEANRQLKDTARDLKDAGSLIGLSPYQRQMRENENANRRERETQTMGGPASSSSSGGSFTRDQKLDMIERYESGGRNIRQQIVPDGGGYNPSVGRVTRPSSAQGFFQITNPTWRDGARMAGVDLGQYPNAMAAPYGVQRQVAGALMDQRGMAPWAPYNANLRNALGGQGNAAANDNGTSRNANTMKEAYEGWNTPLANANRTLNEQIALQGQAQRTWLMSTAEITAAAEKQRLYNEYAQQGVPITSSLAAGIEDYSRRAGQAAQANENFANTAKALRDIGDASKDALKGFISDIRNGVSGADAFKNALNRIADKLIDMAVNDIFGKAFGGSGGGGLTGLIGKVVGGFGGSTSVTGGGLGTTAGTGGLWAEGGYTGSGGKWEPAGIVHRGEVVWSQRDVARAGGAHVVDAMRRGVSGYADGGTVGQAWANNLIAQVSSARGMSMGAANGNTRPAVTVNVTNSHPGATVETKQNDDGTIEMIVSQIEGRIADNVAHGRGALNTSVASRMNNRQLRG